MFTKRLEQSQSSSQPKTGFAGDTCATRSNGAQDTMSLFSADLDTANAEKLHLFATGGFFSECFEVTLHRFAEKLRFENSLKQLFEDLGRSTPDDWVSRYLHACLVKDDISDVADAILQSNPDIMD
jgi:hypothetical protein